ncbi:MAG: VCBS repeat-containing protein [Acidobacteria bacterium]|nr:VCBS repeat-containing protein [Acidobacteriota bacterium]
MIHRLRPSLRPAFSAVACAVLLAAMAACRPAIPEKASGEYAAAIKSFYVGLAAMQVADDVRAKLELENAVKLAGGEPAAWANLGVLQMRQKDFDAALKSLERARGLAPESGRIYANLAVLQSQRGNFDEVRKNLLKAIEVDPSDAKPIFALAEEFERDGNDADALARYESILKILPENPAVVIEVMRLAAKRNDLPKAKAAFAIIRPRPDYWEKEIVEQHSSLATSVEAGNTREVTQKIAFFRNVLLRVPEFRGAIDDVKYSKTTIGEPFTRPLKLSVPDFSPAAHDEELAFAAEIVADERAAFAAAVFADGDSAPAVAFGSEGDLRIGGAAVRFAARDIAAIDIDYDFRNDFVAAGPKGLRFFSADQADLTGATKLPAPFLAKGFSRVFTFDIEIDGDLDLLTVGENSSLVALQNNADGTFKQIPTFGEVSGATDFVSADVDEDGDMDAVFVAGAKLLVFSNERGGQFRPRTVPAETALAVEAGDLNGDGRLDLVVLQPDGKIIRTTDKGGKTWETAAVAESGNLDNPSLAIQDLDNNGAVDIVCGGRIWLTGRDGKVRELKNRIDGRVESAADLDADGRLDLVGLDAAGRPARWLNRGSKPYGWQIIRPRSAKAQGDQRVNSFGIGGEMELRSGLLAQKRPIASPQVHFGLGEQTSTDLLRVIWGNGFIQAEFDLAKDQQILVKQRLTGSCPHLFAWNGSEFKLVKDAAPLATSLGLRVSDKEILPVTQTEEWYKIPGEALAPKDGFYELRVTDELWESYYVDHYSLLAVDHPVGTEVFANELYPIPTPLRLHSTSVPRRFASATDEKGNDVAALVSEADEVYLDTFADGRYQGVAEEHFVELELPADAPRDTGVKIIADGWLHPTDTSLNVAISQSGFEKPKGLSLDVQDANGRWRTVKDDFGVPAGKLKTIVVELPPGIRRARLRTNMEIFWDKLAWAETVSDESYGYQRIDLADAELNFRGFSVIEKKGESAPEIPDYNRLATTIERWRSIEGYYTRYGSIRELLASADDRYAIVSSGDEMRLRFRELPPVKPGFTRDFVFVGVGWIKEGDYNNLYSKTVLPLPTHATNDYSRPPGRLEDDPVFQRNKRDWIDFHTRYVAPDAFRNAVRK